MSDTQTQAADEIEVKGTRPATGSTYLTRAITPTFQLTSAGKLIELSGLRVDLQVADAMLPTSSTIVMRINGMRLSDMNALTVAGLGFYAANPGSGLQNYITVRAGDSTGMATVFSGSINDAYPDGHQPDMGFIVRAAMCVAYTMPSQTDNSFQGSVNIVTVLTQLCSVAGLTLNNGGVTGTLLNPHFSGSILDQIKAAVQMADAYGSISVPDAVLTVRPKVGGTPPSSVVTFSPANGMIGYPQFEQQDIVIRSIFRPEMWLKSADPFSVDSQFTAAKNAPDYPWICSNVDYHLASQTPGGPWEMSVRGYSSKGVATGHIPPGTG